MNQIDPLLAMHRRRLTQDEIVLAERRRALAECEAQQAQCQQELNDYRARALEREMALFAALIGCVVKQEKVDIVNDAVAAMRKTAAGLAAALEQAGQAVDAAAVQLEQARLAYQRQDVRTEKFADVANDLSMAGLQAAQYREELEAEDNVRRPK